MGELAPGRYCLPLPGTCYCGECEHYKPIERTRRELRAMADMLSTRSRNPNIKYHRRGDRGAR